MKGLRKAASETRDANPRMGGYVQVSYDMADGEILANYHASLGCNSWTEYHSESIIAVCNAQSRMTMQQIADAIADAVARHNA